MVIIYIKKSSEESLDQLWLGLGYAFRITDFLHLNSPSQDFSQNRKYFDQNGQSFSPENQIFNQDRQDTDLERQDSSPLLILPIVAVGFFASLIAFLGIIFNSIFSSPGIHKINSR